VAQAVGHFGRSQPHSFEDLRGDKRRGHGDALAGECALGEQIDVLAGVVGVVRECELRGDRHGLRVDCDDSSQHGLATDERGERTICPVMMTSWPLCSAKVG